jgi:hypothetical protein
VEEDPGACHGPSQHGIRLVTDHWMVDGGHVNPDLMGPACAQ